GGKRGGLDRVGPGGAEGATRSRAGEGQAAGNVHPEEGGRTKAVPTTGSQSPAAERGRQAVDHDPPAGTESLAGTPHMGAADAIKDDVHALAREAVDLSHEVLNPVIDRDGAQVGDRRRPSRRTGAVHLQPGEASELQQ